MQTEQPTTNTSLVKNEVLDERRATLVLYLLMKVRAGDWHGVSDAANDIREIEAIMKDRRGE